MGRVRRAGSESIGDAEKAHSPWAEAFAGAADGEDVERDRGEPADRPDQRAQRRLVGQVAGDVGNAGGDEEDAQRVEGGAVDSGNQAQQDAAGEERGSLEAVGLGGIDAGPETGLARQPGAGVAVVVASAAVNRKYRAISRSPGSAVPEIRLALLDEGGHAFLLVFEAEAGVEGAALEGGLR